MLTDPTATPTTPDLVDLGTPNPAPVNAEPHLQLTGIKKHGKIF
jgi:hypothetical protein